MITSRRLSESHSPSVREQQATVSPVYSDKKAIIYHKQTTPFGSVISNIHFTIVDEETGAVILEQSHKVLVSKDKSFIRSRQAELQQKALAAGYKNTKFEEMD